MSTRWALPFSFKLMIALIIIRLAESFVEGRFPISHANRTTTSFDSRTSFKVAAPSGSPKPGALATAAASESVVSTTKHATPGTLMFGPTQSPRACERWGNLRCAIVYEGVDVYYWPSTPNNTPCPTAAPLRPRPNLNLSTIQSPSIYVHFSTIYATDDCGRKTPQVTNVVTSWPPDKLKEFRSHASSFSDSDIRFEDLPCPSFETKDGPREGIFLDWLAPPDSIFTQEPAFPECPDLIPPVRFSVHFVQNRPAGSGRGPACGHHCGRKPPHK